MKIIINNTSMVPIYEQIMEQVKTLVIKQKLLENDMLPSVRGLSKELRISALTVKKAYDLLEEEGIITTVHGKGSYINKVNSHMLEEEVLKDIESDLITLIKKARDYNVSSKDLEVLFDLLNKEDL